METQNLTMVRGDTYAFDLTLNLDESVTVEGIAFSCKKKETDTEYIFTKTLDDGITLTEGSTYRVRVAPEDTEGVKAGTYYYDLELKLGDDVYTPLKGTMKIIQDVTR